jgi:acetyl esterase/lipase
VQLDQNNNMRSISAIVHLKNPNEAESPQRPKRLHCCFEAVCRWVSNLQMNRTTLFIILWICLTAGCTRFDLLNTVSPPIGCTRTADIAYGPLPREMLDVYEPHHAGLGKKRIVIFFYGGYWKVGSKDDYRFVGQALSSEDFIAVLPDYRLYPSVIFPAFVQDGALAVKWVHDNAQRLGGDPDHIYLMGHSAGAHIAALLTLDPKYLRSVGLDRGVIRGFAGLSGPYDFKIGPELRPAFGMPPTTGPVNPDIEPIHFVDGKEPPMLLLQGGNDHTVEPGNTTRLADKIRAAGGQVTAIIYPGRSHVDLALSLSIPFRWIAPALRDSAAFFRSH